MSASGLGVPLLLPLSTALGPSIAYQLQAFEIVGGPAWINSDRFDVDARGNAENRMRPGGMTGGSITMAQLAGNFSRVPGRVVADETGLVGRFDLTLEWAPDSALRCRRQTARRCLPPRRNNWDSSSKP